MIVALVFVAGLGASVLAARAQAEGQVQQLSGYIERGTIAQYRLPDLQQGQTIDVFAAATSGNLDPFVAIVDGEADVATMQIELRSAFDLALAAGEPPLEAIGRLAGETFLAWNDDDGEGSSSAVLVFPVPESGDYQLVLFSSPLQVTFGNYGLTIGIDAPEVLTGRATPTGDTVAVPHELSRQPQVSVDVLTGTLSASRPFHVFTLRDVAAGDTVYAYAAAETGDWGPSLVLENFRAKPLATANHLGHDDTAALEYTFSEDTSQVRLRLADVSREGDRTYRLVVGLNAPQAQTGDAAPTDLPAIISPTIVRIGVKMDQIASVDQVAENFSVVADVRAEWGDPRLAFNPDECNCFFQTFTDTGFVSYLTRKGVTNWPRTTLYNQQGRRDSQSETFVVGSDGSVIYVTRFTATLQAPDFNFRLFPFDSQEFYIRLRSVFPEDFFVFTDLAGFTEVGAQLGEEEWVVTSYETFTDTSEDSSRFNFRFTAKRHLDYYLYRVFLPLLIIVIVSWALFFLKDYAKRVDAAAANLLLLIAFNFTISGNLPRLGYLTLMDALLITAFVVTSSVLLLNVYLKRLEVSGKQERATRLDAFVITYYPIAYILFTGGVFAFFWFTQSG